MTSCLRITAGGEYAVKVMAALALEPAGRRVTIGALARQEEIPPSFLAKILRTLARAGLVIAAPGPRGGVRLSRPAAEVTLLSIMEAYEGPFSRQACAFSPGRPCPEPRCRVHCPLRRAEDEVRDRLKRIGLREMAASLARHPDRGARRAR
ncbi:MAG: Rrf2 family transcriptional regulator [bacterium]